MLPTQPNRPAFHRPAFSVVDKNHPDPLMGRGYISVRATGGAVASSPYRGNRWSSEKRVKLASTFSSRDRGRRSQTW